MANKKKNKSSTKTASSQSLQTKLEAVKEALSIESVKNSENEDDFLIKKDMLIAQLEKEIVEYEKMKSDAEKEANIAEAMKNELETKIRSLREERSQLTDEVVFLKKEREEAEKKIKAVTEEADKIKADAEEEACKTLEAAEAEKIKRISEGSSAAQKAWKKQTDKLQKQIEDISEREGLLIEQKNQLQREHNELEYEKEDLAELKEYLNTLKDKYQSANPSKLSALEMDLKYEKERYGVLWEKYNSLSSKYQENQVILDSIKAEVPESGNQPGTVSQIISELQEFKTRYDSLAEIHKKYKDEDEIIKLEEKAGMVASLEAERDALELEKNRYKIEAAAARNASRELEVIRQEVEATDALNKHLLQELESHKTALESRTGDTCPSLSKVDAEVEDADFIKSINNRFRRKKLTSLAQIVTHVKNFAGSGCGNNGVKLYYSDNDIRAFLSGMAVSKLLILQGMSGTGKSSLPEVFAEAIYGFERLIPVESSWRDRNELLGYYNDFNKKFNAKTFTIELYRLSKERCGNIPSFIILDEMNLARIEYYFSDFLSILQKANKDEWVIELVSSDMRTLPMELPEDVKDKMQKEDASIYSIWEKIERSRQGDLTSETSDEEKEELTSYLAKMGRLTGAKDLIDGRKIRVTNNIWFIGTANRDESTFEISDKVYDRAQIISLNKKGTSEGNYPKTDRQFISTEELQALFNESIQSFKGEKDVTERLNVLDDVLMNRFDISFGNRIVTQTIVFAAVFTAAGGTIEDALDYQISTKILRKVITSDDEEALLELQTVTTDYSETQRLLEKRIKELGR